MRERNRRWQAQEALPRSDERAGQEREKAAGDRMQLEEGFLSHVSHELRTPLSSIHQFTTLLLDGLAGDVSAEAREYLEVVLRNAEQLKRMIGDLLTLTRCGSGKLTLDPAFTSLGELIQHACRSLQAAVTAGSISLSTDFPSNLPAVYMDAARIYEVLTNLIDNAIKHTPRGGKVVVKAERSKNRPKFVRVSVCDTGHGIGPENAKRVFERFYQVPEDAASSRRGLGLGLYISQELIKAHGGSLGLESELGHGTAVSFTLPIFSLAPLILPLLSAQNLSKGSMVFVAIKLPAPEELSARHAQRYSRAARKVLERCIRSGSDILLPRFDANQSPDHFYVLAFADPGEAETIVHRIKQDVSRFQAAALFGESVEAFSTTIALPRSRTGPLLEIANHISRRIEKVVEGEGLHRQPESEKRFIRQP
ncbi:MAG TPA: ATP-binding protein [Terriglobia bacterium]|nr:ATP-binding protein [Terriglobia bacterium]